MINSSYVAAGFCLSCPVVKIVIFGNTTNWYIATLNINLEEKAHCRESSYCVLCLQLGGLVDWVFYNVTLTCSAVCCRSQSVPLCHCLTGWQAGWHTVKPLLSCASLAFWNTDWLTTLLSDPWARANERSRLSCCPASIYSDWMTSTRPLHSRDELEYTLQNYQHKLWRKLNDCMNNTAFSLLF